MVRQRTRNTLEEVYGPKFDAAKSQANSINNNNKVVKDHGYIISSNLPYSNISSMPPSSNATNPLAMNTSRRKSARTSTRTPLGPQPQKFTIKEEKDDGKKELQSNMKMKSSRGASGNVGGGTMGGGNCDKWQYDNKTYRGSTLDNRKDIQAHGDGGQYIQPTHHQQQGHRHQNHQHQDQHQHHHHHHHQQHDDEKDDDTEEFFELIRQTVEGAIGKSVSELLNRNFRELSSKVDRFSAELKNTNEMLNKIQMELNNRIVHYGEENSRHFRYLCMKSEYDKMFYQHQTMISSAQPVSSDTIQPQPQVAEMKSSSTTKSNSATPQKKRSKEITINTINDTAAPCSCRSTTNQVAVNPPATKEPHKSSSEENHVTPKSSDVGMREILDHIQRFCMQMNANKKNERPSGSQSNIKSPESIVRLMDTYMAENGVHINPHMFRDMEADEDDELGISSDGMTPRSDDDFQMQNYGGMTKRGSNSARVGVICGAGDGGGDA